jgi:hypothetical protein
MGNNKICISKQTTFVSIVVLLLIGYIFTAYFTLSNKTNTNSRASAPRQNMKIFPTAIPVLAPNCYSPVPTQLCLVPYIYGNNGKQNTINLTLSSVDFKTLLTKNTSTSNFVVMSVSVARATGAYTYIPLKWYTKKELQDNLLSNYVVLNIPDEGLIDLFQSHFFIIYGVPNSKPVLQPTSIILQQGLMNKCSNTQPSVSSCKPGSKKQD